MSAGKSEGIAGTGGAMVLDDGDTDAHLFDFGGPLAEEGEGADNPTDSVPMSCVSIECKAALTK